MEFEPPVIKCVIFLDTEAVIKNTDVKISQAKSIKERQYYAGDILLEARILLSCSNYKTNDPDCEKCHSILQRYIQEYKYLAKDIMR